MNPISNKIDVSSFVGRLINEPQKHIEFREVQVFLQTVTTEQAQRMIIACDQIGSRNARIFKQWIEAEMIGRNRSKGASAIEKVFHEVLAVSDNPYNKVKNPFIKKEEEK